jgi:aminocarboxymuconate-semialdehyde decarboxylase
MTITIDVHAHVAPIYSTVALEDGDVIWRDGALTVDGQRIGQPDLFDSNMLITWLDRHDIARAMISIPPPFYQQQLGPSDAQAWAEYVNRCLRAVTYDRVFRLTPLFHLPIERPAVALASLEQLVTQPRFKGVALSAGGWEAIDYADPVHDARSDWPFPMGQSPGTIS